MKSHKSEVLQVEWLIQQIRELDHLIAMHRSGDSNFVADQYAARRLQYFKELISLLAASKLNATGLETFPLIHALTSENYTKSEHPKVKSAKQNAFDLILKFYQKRSDVSQAKGISRWVTKKSSTSAKKSATADTDKVMKSTH